MNYTRQAFYGFLWVFAGGILANLFGYLLRLLLARSLSVAEYGLVYAVMAFFGFFALFQGLGLGETIVRYVSSATVHKDHAQQKQVIVWSIVLLYSSTALVAGIMFFMAQWLAIAYFKAGIAADLVRLYAVAFLLSPVGVWLPSAFLGKQRTDLHAIYMTTQAAILLAVTAAMIYAGLGARGAMMAYVALMVLQHIIFVPVLLRAVPGLMRTRTSYLLSTPKELLSYGLPVMATGLASVVLFYTDTALLTYYSTLEEVGIYQAALPTANILLFATAALPVVLLPLASVLWERGERTLLAASVSDMYKYLALAVVPLILSIAAFPDIVINLLFGAEYLPGAPTLRVLAAAALFLTLNAVNVSVLSGIGMPKMNTAAVGAAAVANLIGNLILIPRYGSLGAGISTFLSAVLMVALSTILVRRALPVRIPVRALSLVCLASAAFFAVLLLSRLLPVGSQYLKTALGLVLAASAYCACAFLLRILTVRECRELLARVMQTDKNRAKKVE